MESRFMDEGKLIERASAGDSDAFGLLVSPHLGLFFNGILRILGNRAVCWHLTFATGCEHRQVDLRRTAAQCGCIVG